MRHVLFMFFFIVPFFAAAQGQAPQQPETKTVGYEEDFTFNADSTALVVRVKKVEETALDETMQQQVITSLDERIKQLEASITALKEQKRKILSLTGLLNYRKNRLTSKP